MFFAVNLQSFWSVNSEASVKNNYHDPSISTQSIEPWIVPDGSSIKSNQVYFIYIVPLKGTSHDIISIQNKLLSISLGIN